MTLIACTARRMGEEPDRDVVFLHGAFQGPWFWRNIVDELVHTPGLRCSLLCLPGSHLDSGPSHGDPVDPVRRVAAAIRDLGGSRELVLVGHSLGAIVACHVAPLLSADFKLTLLLSSMPLWLPAWAVESRIKLGQLLNVVGRWIGRRRLPLVLRSRLLSDPSHLGLLRLVGSAPDLHGALRLLPGGVSVHLACGHLDPIAGPLGLQRAFSQRLGAAGITTSFTSLGYTSHAPSLLSPSRYVRWVHARAGLPR